MNKNEYLTVAEFASAVNSTRATIYNHMKTDLKEFVNKDGKVKRIHIDGLKLFEIGENADVTRQSTDSDNPELLKELETKLKSLEERLKGFEGEYKQLKEREEAKNDTINALLGQLSEKDSQIAELHKLLDQQQRLQLQVQQQQLPAKTSWWEKVKKRLTRLTNNNF